MAISYSLHYVYAPSRGDMQEGAIGRFFGLKIRRPLRSWGFAPLPAPIKVCIDNWPLENEANYRCWLFGFGQRLFLSAMVCSEVQRE